MKIIYVYLLPKVIELVIRSIAADEMKKVILLLH